MGKDATPGSGEAKPEVRPFTDSPRVPAANRERERERDVQPSYSGKVHGRVEHVPVCGTAAFVRFLFF